MNALEQTAWSCLSCGAASSRARFQVPGPLGPVQVVCCSACGFECAWPRPDLSGYYGEDYYIFGEAEDRKQQERARSLFRMVHRRVPRGRWLDVGAAKGDLVHLARGAGYEAYGLEISEAAVRLGRERFGLDSLERGTIAELRESWRGFDTITLFEVVEHLPDPVADLAFLRQRLAPGGRIILSVPNAGSAFKAMFGERWQGYNAFHLSYFRKPDLASVARAAGLRLRRSWSRTGNTRSLSDLLVDSPGWRYLPRSKLALRAVRWGAVMPLAALANRLGAGETLFAELIPA